jgi:hypothetical protein
MNSATDAVGTYTISNNGTDHKFSEAYFDLRLPGNVAGGFDDYAVSGTLTFATIDTTTVVGSYDVQMASGSTSKGSFNAPICAGLSN